MDSIAIRDYNTLVSDIIQKQIIIFGLPLALMKLRQIHGLSVSDDGTIISMPADPKTIMKPLIDQFNTISPSVVKKTMKPIILLTESIADLKKEEESETTAPPNTVLTKSNSSQQESQDKPNSQEIPAVKETAPQEPKKEVN